jgi:hypothetical protein
LEEFERVKNEKKLASKQADAEAEDAYDDDDYEDNEEGEEFEESPRQKVGS